MKKPKQHIAFLFSSVAILALLLHGILPHHHHDTETTMCQIEQQLPYSGCQDTGFNPETNNQDDSHSHELACSFNGSKIKNFSISLLAVVKITTFKASPEKKSVLIAYYDERITSSPHPDLSLLRAPPLG